MREYENQCVGCPSEMGCLGIGCPNRNVPIDYCDQCGCEGATYRIDGEDLCDDCASEYMQEEFSNLSIHEQAELLNVYISNIY